MASCFQLLMWCLRVTREGPAPVEGVDWQQFLNLAESHGVRPLVHQALAEASPPELTRFFRAHAMRLLLLAVHLAAQLGAPIPPELTERAQRDPRVQALAAGVWRDIENPAGLDEMGLFLWGLKVQDRWRDRLLRCLLILTRPTAADQAFLPLPRSLSFLHILTHPIRILCQRILR